MSNCKQCPHEIGDITERDCDFPDCMGGYEAVLKTQANELAELRAELELSLKRQIQFQDAHTEEQERADALQSRLDAYEKQVLPEEVQDVIFSLEHPWPTGKGSHGAEAVNLIRRFAHQQAASGNDLWSDYFDEAERLQERPNEDE